MSKKVATIIIEDYVNVTVAGITPVDTSTLVKNYAVYTDNYFFSPEYQLGRWDGKFKFFTNGNRTYGIIILEVVEDLKAMGYKIKIDNRRRNFNIQFKDNEKPTVDYFKNYGWELAPHQLKAILSVLDTLDGIIKVGTGGGKTLITAVLADLFLNKNLKTIIIVPNKDLIDQTKKAIAEFGIDVGAYYADEKTADRPVVVSTWQSLAKNKKLITSFDAFMVDECHGSQANTLFNILSKEGSNVPIRIGLTGTLPEGECSLLKTHAVIGPVRAKVKSNYLIKEGWLAKPNLFMVRYMEDFHEEYEEYKKHAVEESDKNISYNEFKQHKLFPEFQNEKTYLTSNEDRLENIASIIDSVTEEYGNTFVLVNTIKFGKKLVKILSGDAFFIDSNIKDRKPIYEEFGNKNSLKGVATYSLASTGLDIPRIFNLILIDGGKSSIKVVQSIGRGLRKAKDKDSVNVFDIHSNTKFSMRHAGRRKKIYKNEKFPFEEIKLYDYQNNQENAVQKCLKKVKLVNSENVKKNLKEGVFEK
jgi:superfamily II DNA or RNA helicase